MSDTETPTRMWLVTFTNGGKTMEIPAVSVHEGKEEVFFVGGPPTYESTSFLRHEVASVEQLT